jgi:hypothetical protein
MAKQPKVVKATEGASAVSDSAAEGTLPADQAGAAEGADDEGTTDTDTTAGATSEATTEATADAAADTSASGAEGDTADQGDAAQAQVDGDTSATQSEAPAADEQAAADAAAADEPVDLGPFAGLEFPVTGTLRNHGSAPFTELVTGKLMQPGGSEEVTLHDEAQASRFISNLADIRKHLVLPDWAVAVEVHKRAPQESE